MFAKFQVQLLSFPKIYPYCLISNSSQYLFKHRSKQKDPSAVQQFKQSIIDIG